jgi:phosphatidate cytidylyltransferase
MKLPSFQLKHFDNANLRLRVISAALLAPLILLAVYLGGLVYGAVVTGAVTLGFFEWLRLVDPDARPKIVGIACSLLIAIMTVGSIFSPLFGALLGVVLTLVFFLIAARDNDQKAGWAALGIPYMGGSGLALLAVRGDPDNGLALTFFLLVTVWGTDIGAFIAGRLIGGPKLAPSVSPSKTWTGLIGGMALASVLGYLAALSFGARHPAVALALSPTLAVVAQLGDLFESYFKRRSGVKESGDLIPGHGGILDRIDGLVFAGVFIALFQAALAGKNNWW